MFTVMAATTVVVKVELARDMFWRVRLLPRLVAKIHTIWTMTKIIIVATSASELKGHATGLWIEELAVPYYKFKEAGFEVVIASPAGGPIPIDKSSMGEGFFDATSKKFMVCTAI